MTQRGLSCSKNQFCRCKWIGYKIDVNRRLPYLFFFNVSTLDNFAFLFYCMTMGRSIYDPDLILPSSCWWLWWDPSLLYCCYIISLVVRLFPTCHEFFYISSVIYVSRTNFSQRISMWLQYFYILCILNIIETGSVYFYNKVDLTPIQCIHVHNTWIWFCYRRF